MRDVFYIFGLKLGAVYAKHIGITYKDALFRGAKYMSDLHGVDITPDQAIEYARGFEDGYLRQLSLLAQEKDKP